MLAFVLLASAAVCACALVWSRGRRARKLLGQLPSYPRLPLLGNAHQMLGSSEHLMNVVVNISHILERTALPFAAWIGPVPVIILSEPEDVKAVTNTFIEKPYYYSFAKDYLGNGLLTAPGVMWKHNIKKLSGTFTGSVVDGYQEVFNAQASKLVDQLKCEVGSEPFNLLDKHLSFITMETICQTALGYPSITKSIVTTEYYEAFTRTMELLVRRGMNLLTHLDFVYQMTPMYREYKKCIAILHNVSDTIIKRRLEERNDLKRRGLFKSNDTEDNGRSKFKSFLDILLELKDVDPTMSDEQMKAEIDTIILGGQETVATTLFLVFLMIGKRPDIQAKLYSEIKEIFGDSKRPVKKEDLLRLKYSEALINETMRLLPPVPFLMRYADQDLSLKSCTIPEGTACGINVWAAGRSKRAWGPDAGDFKPERWLEEGGVPGYPTSYYVFGYGRRGCIGKRYAMAILKTIVTYVARDLRLTSEASELRLKIDVGLKPVSGHRVQVHLRN